MSVFHHRAQLVEGSDEQATYRYFPDTAIDPTCQGVFTVSLSTWTFVIARTADAEARVGVTSDSQCVSRLVEKLRAKVQEGGSLPREIMWIA